MREFRKIERGENKQSVEVHQPIRRYEIPGYRQLLNILGWIQLKLNRPLILPENILTWATDETGYNEDNTTLATNEWHGIKFSIENLRGELARLEKHPTADEDVDVWVFNAGDEGAYRISGHFEIVFADQDSADWYAPGTLVVRLAKNWKPLKRVFGRCNMTARTSPINLLSGIINGSDIVYLKAGDKLSLFLPLVGGTSPAYKTFTVTSHVAINYLGKKTRQITDEVTEWVSV